jgi:4-alpha-glucanotransferase
VLERARIEGERYVRLELKLPGPWPAGIHRLAVEIGTLHSEATLVSAPRRAWSGPEGGPGRSWGVFVPLYALHSKRSSGIGDFADLRSLVHWTSRLGGRTVATLPLLAAFVDRPFEPSPYLPVSRLFWNEIFLAFDRIPELKAARRAAGVARSSIWRREISRLRAAAEVDYRALADAKRRLLEPLARDFFSRPSARREAFAAFTRARPEVLDYARFRATLERRGTTWPTWPARLRDGRLRGADYDGKTVRYHAFVQWLATEQLEDVARKAGKDGDGLQLDLPLGVHPDGYDVWRNPGAFALGASTGCPPDELFTGGQNWGFPPPHPDRIREQGHGYFAACLRHHMRVGGTLRIDHVMGLHRLFWIPRGFGAEDGVYVRYPARERYALICLESHRHRCAVVGEDLGIVPPSVRPVMKRHGLKRTFILEYACQNRGRWPLSNVAVSGFATLNTHDVPPFAGFWRGREIDDRLDLGLLSRAGAGRERSRRARLLEAILRDLRRQGRVTADHPTVRSALRGCLSFLAGSDADLLMVNLEDLWLETRPQNVPGTTTERPNWRRKARHPLEEIRRMPGVLRTLAVVDRLRRGTGRDER